MKNITILGATGSIGTQTVDVIKNHQDLFTCTAVSCASNINKLKEILDILPVSYVAVSKEEDAIALKELYPNITFFFGERGLLEIATLNEVDIVLNAIVGFAGLLPTIEAIKKGKDIALANKETLVAAGHIIMPLCRKHHVKLLPVDSEHSAIFQSIQASPQAKINKILLTCSGGSFRDKTLEELKDVTVDQALRHPNWQMGAKITIDSATLFNKGLEVIEAHWLFDVDYDDIEVLIHPESILHSAIEFEDTAVIGQMGTPDMRLPIQYALTYPQRTRLAGAKRLSLTDLSVMHFSKPDTQRFRALDLAYEAGRTGGSMPCVLNSANEVANAYFREGKIAFLDIVTLVERAMRQHQVIPEPTLEEILTVDQETRAFVRKEVSLYFANHH